MPNLVARFRTFLNAKTSPEKIDNKTKFFLSLPTMPVALSNALIHMAYIKFYTDMVGLDVKFVGWLYMLFGIWNAINDPLLGVWMDRMKFRKGRGKFVYLMRVTAPITLLASFLMLFAQPSWTDWLIFVFMFILLFIFDTTQTAYSIAYASYVFVAAPTKEERVDVSVVTTYVGHIGSFLGSIIPTLILVGESNRSLTIAMFSGVLIVNSLLYFFALKPLKDSEEMYKDEIESSEGSFARQLKIIAKDAISSKAFLSYILFQAIGRGPTMIYFTAFLYMADYVLGLNGLEATLVDVLPGLILLLVVPLFGKFTKKYGLKKAALIAAVPLAFSFLGLYFVQNIWQALIVYILIALFNGVFFLIHPPMMGAIVDEDEQRTGVRKAGFFTGLNALLTIPVGGLHTVVFTTILGAFTFMSGSEVQSAQAVQGIRIASSAVPFIFVLLGMIPLAFSNITLNKEKELSEFSEQRHRDLNGTAQIE